MPPVLSQPPLKPASRGRASPHDDGATLIDALLAEQRQLTAVETFARSHDREPGARGRYRDLLPATSPAAGQQYAFEVDLDQCSGCKACVTACHSLNGLDETETWRSVGQLVSTDWRTPVRQTVTSACHHCVDPGCLNGCPVLAYDKDPVTGIVRHLDDQCIGCQYCIMKCPYEVPQYSRSRGIVRKCDMCSSRLAIGEAPACVQACPNEAIRITLVVQARVRGKYRPWPAIKEEHEACGATVNAFLPESPNPGITLPTTRYRSQRPLPANLRAGEGRAFRLQPAHPPLTWMLVGSQLGAGMAVINALAVPSRTTAFAALAAALAGILVGPLHLGQPLKAWRSFLGWRKSWLSRELLAFGAFAAALLAHLICLQILTGLVAALAGLGAVACSAMVYVDTRRPFWSAPFTLGKFFGTVLVLGAAGSLVLVVAGLSAAPAAGFLAALVVAGAFIKLSVERRISDHLAEEQSPELTPLNQTAILLHGVLGWQTRVRLVCGVLGAALAPAAVLAGPGNGVRLAAAGFALCLAAEVIERHLFFVAEVAPRMPGGGRS